MKKVDREYNLNLKKNFPAQRKEKSYVRSIKDHIPGREKPYRHCSGDVASCGCHDAGWLRKKQAGGASGRNEGKSLTTITGRHPKKTLHLHFIEST